MFQFGPKAETKTYIFPSYQEGVAVVLLDVMLDQGGLACPPRTVHHGDFTGDSQALEPSKLCLGNINIGRNTD